MTVRSPSGRRSSSPGRSRATPPSPRSDDPALRRERFLAVDAYRADREWKRYEGTPQRDLFRELRHRFLRRHAAESPWVVDIGAGPGRFTGDLGGPGSHRVALDLSREMLLRMREPSETTEADPAGSRSAVVGDALRPPFERERFGEVAVIGNTIGFAGSDALALVAAVESLVAPGGTLIVEVAPGPGERSKYLTRLPAAAVGRLLASPPRAVVPRIDREGFALESERHESRGFARFEPTALAERWIAAGWEVLETVAVAPALGADPSRIAAVRKLPRAWDRLLELEETVGHDPRRWSRAAAVLLAARRGLRRHD